MFTRLLKSTAVLVAAVACGCSTKPQMDYSSVGLVPVSGVVTMDGRPLQQAVITFDSPDGTYSYARTDEDGYYELQFDTVVDGATPGPKTVQISTSRSLLGLDPVGGEEDAGGDEVGDEPVAKKEEQVPAKYNKNSELMVEVSSDNTEFNFDLTST